MTGITSMPVFVLLSVGLMVRLCYLCNINERNHGL